MAEILRPALGLLPVASFLAVLLLLDSYKLVRLRAVVGVVLAGMLAAGVAYAVNGALLAHLEFATYTRYVAPFIEEALKALVIAALIRAHRVGFLVDAAIFGFAVGTGFALVENLNYLALQPDSALGTWVVRGFGTALMHGGAAASFAVVADMLCYLRVHTELALRAKGVLLARENGFDVPLDAATREKFAELGYLEKSVGRTGLLALHPVLRKSRRDLWQLYLLGK